MSSGSILSRRSSRASIYKVLIEDPAVRSVSFSQSFDGFTQKFGINPPFWGVNPPVSYHYCNLQHVLTFFWEINIKCCKCSFSLPKRESALNIGSPSFQQFFTGTELKEISDSLRKELAKKKEVSFWI